MFTRQGFSPDVTFPRILGIEAVGEVEQDPSGHYQAGQKVAAVLGGMGGQDNCGLLLAPAESCRRAFSPDRPLLRVCFISSHRTFSSLTSPPGCCQVTLS